MKSALAQFASAHVGRVGEEGAGVVTASDQESEREIENALSCLVSARGEGTGPPNDSAVVDDAVEILFANRASTLTVLSRWSATTPSRVIEVMSALCVRRPELVTESQQHGQASTSELKLTALVALEALAIRASNPFVFHLLLASWFFSTVVMINHLSWWGAVGSVLALVAAFNINIFFARRTYARVRPVLIEYLVQNGISLGTLLQTLEARNRQLPRLHSLRFDLTSDVSLAAVSLIGAFRRESVRSRRREEAA